MNAHSTGIVYSMKRTTIEIDEELLARAKKALGAPTARATVAEALRRAADQAGGEQAHRALLQRSFLERLSDEVDVETLAEGKMWR